MPDADVGPGSDVMIPRGAKAGAAAGSCAGLINVGLMICAAGGFAAAVDAAKATGAGSVFGTGSAAGAGSVTGAGSGAAVKAVGAVVSMQADAARARNGGGGAEAALEAPWGRPAAAAAGSC